MEEIIGDILTLVKKKMTEQGGFSREAYNEYIDETIEYFKEKGKITEEDNYEFIKDQLRKEWKQTIEELASE